MNGEIKAMSFNVRIDVDKEANDFELRKTRIFDFINSEKPDVIGFQEASDRMRKDFRDNLCDYTVVGCGRDKKYLGEGTPIAYRTDDFELIEFKTFWLSSTPEIPASRYGDDQSGCPRITVAALLKKNDGGKPFWFINTHLDHEGEMARRLGSSQLLQFISTLKYPVILVGDMNAAPDESSMRAFVKDKHCTLTDATANIKGSFHAYRSIPEEEMKKIDYIFTSFKEYGESVLHEDVPVNGTYMSDHRALSVNIKLEY